MSDRVACRWCVIVKSWKPQDRLSVEREVPPKFATTMANRRAKGKCRQTQLEIQCPSADMTDHSKNPHFDPNLASKAFHPGGLASLWRSIKKGNTLRRRMLCVYKLLSRLWKKKFAEAAGKVGIDEDMHANKAFAVSFPPPHVYKLANSLSQCEPAPKIEWWDQGLTITSSYQAITPESIIISAVDTIVTHYVQYPILHAQPQEKLTLPMKPFLLTNERAKESRPPTPRRSPRRNASESPPRPGTPTTAKDQEIKPDASPRRRSRERPHSSGSAREPGNQRTPQGPLKSERRAQTNERKTP